MRTKPQNNNFAVLLQRYFYQRLIEQHNCTKDTISTYRYTFKLLLEYLRDKHKISPDAVALEDLNSKNILEFLKYLEQDRHNSINSRNNRLAAIRSFLKYTAYQVPTSLPMVQKVLANHPPGHGPALLQGLIICGVCGQRMTLRYHSRYGKIVPDYICQRHGIEYGQPICQSIPGYKVDQAVEQLLLELVRPVTLEIALTVQQEVQQRLKEADKLRYQKVQRAQYQTDLAKDRFMNIDPRNRLVADQLEADWNDKLRILAEVRQEYEQQHELDKIKLDQQCRDKILSLVKNFPKVWNDPATTDQQRKRMARLIIEDVTMERTEKDVDLKIRLKGGATHQIMVPIPLSAWQARKTKPEIIEEIDTLMDHFTDQEIVDNLNRRGFKPSEGTKFTRAIIGRLRRNYNLKSRYDRLREKGLLTVDEMAERLDVSSNTIKIWRRYGLLKSYKYNDRGERLFERGPREMMPYKSQGLTGKLSERPKYEELASHATNGVQSE